MGSQPTSPPEPDLERPEPTFQWEELDAAIAARRASILADLQPPGTFTVAQYMKREGLKASAARCRLRKMVEHGIIEVVARRRVASREYRFYRVKKG